MLHTFTSEQLHLLLTQPDRSTFKGSRDYAIMLVFLDTGIRVSELHLLSILIFFQKTVILLSAMEKVINPEPFQFKKPIGKQLTTIHVFEVNLIRIIFG
jgi:site-specific recombinase XerC